MFWKKSADAVRIAELEAVNEKLEADNAELSAHLAAECKVHKETCRLLLEERALADALDKSAKAYRCERDNALAKIARMTGGLKQNRKPADTGVAVQH